MNSESREILENKKNQVENEKENESMFTGKRICFYGRSATKVNNVEEYFTSKMHGVGKLEMPDKTDIYFDNG